MGPANIFFLVLASAVLFLPAAQPSNYPTAKPSTVWINDASMEPIVTSFLQPQDYSGYVFAFAAGFACASDQCDTFVFAVFIRVFTAQIGNEIFSKVSQRQVVWSANPARHVSQNAALEFTSDGNLVLRDADGSHVWSSNTSGQSIAGMMINEKGNLVLFDQTNASVWQSFHHPTDTMVPGQSLVEGMRLTSNTSALNTTGKQFYITVLRWGLYAYVESSPPQPYFSYTMGQNKTGNDPTKVTFMNGSLLVQPNRDEGIIIPEALSNQYLRLESDGHLRLYEWSNANWTSVDDVLKIDECAYPTPCGAYSICTGGQCSCPVENNSDSNYFKLVNERKPNLGCTPLYPISCQAKQRHQLLTLPNISYFDDKHMLVNATNSDDCKKACLNNCSCRAVVFRHYQYIAYTECLWVTEIFSLRSIQPEGYNSTTYIKVQLSPSLSASTTNKKKVILGAALGVVTILALFIIVVALYVQKRRKYAEKDEEFDFDQLPGMPIRYSFEKLSECTEGFSKKLGEGGFGSLFEGRLGEERVAVKRLEGARQGKKEFLAEVETIGSIEHINLVSLIGFCAEKFERLLVYEYMSKGSLDKWIYYRHNNAPLNWCTRRKIILDTAKGLCYLHEECKRKIAHLDIKPHNILLDANFNAKVADFGLCKLINRDQSKVVTVMRGTPGYLAPEWLTSRITEKVDVYSFGVVVMEIISGRKNIDNSQLEENVQLVNLLREKAQNNQLADLIDKHSDDMVSHQEEVVQMMKLAIWCLQHDCIQRPSMSAVIKVLEGAISLETFNANSLMFIQDNPSTYSVPFQASILSGPR